jgi:hypothetical protein
MDDLNLLLRYATRVLLWIAPFEFLFGRAISRASRQMPAGDIGAAIFGAISAVGAFLVMPAFILALLILVASALLALRGPAPTLGRAGGGGVAWPRPLAALLLVFLVYNVGLLFPGAPVIALILYNVVSAALALSIAALFVVRTRGGGAIRVTVALFGLAYAGYYVYALAALLAEGAAPTGDAGVWANAFGEGAGMIAGISLLWTAGLFGRGGPRPRRLWLGLAGAAGALVLIAPLFEQWLQGVATQFSVGFTLFLPAPVSALALAAWIYAAFALNSRDAAARARVPWAWEVGAGVLLLPAAGYQLQLNYQHILLMITLLLMTGLLRPLSGPAVEAPARQPAAGRPAPQEEPFA